MTAIKTLAVKHTQTFKGEPLVCFANFPGPDPDLRPQQIRALAAALLVIADDCEAHARSIRRYGDRRSEYAVGA